jgi:hypothetical protein
MLITLSSPTRPLPCYRNIMEIGTEVNLKSPSFMAFCVEWPLGVCCCTPAVVLCVQVKGLAMTWLLCVLPVARKQDDLSYLGDKKGQLIFERSWHLFIGYEGQIYLRTSLFWVINAAISVISFLHFGTNYGSLFQGGFLAHENGTPKRG